MKIDWWIRIAFGWNCCQWKSKYLPYSRNKRVVWVITTIATTWLIYESIISIADVLVTRWLTNFDAITRSIDVPIARTVDVSITRTTCYDEWSAANCVCTTRAIIVEPYHRCLNDYLRTSRSLISYDLANSPSCSDMLQMQIYWPYIFVKNTFRCWLVCLLRDLSNILALLLRCLLYWIIKRLLAYLWKLPSPPWCKKIRYVLKLLMCI